MDFFLLHTGEMKRPREVVIQEENARKRFGSDLSSNPDVLEPGEEEFMTGLELYQQNGKEMQSIPDLLTSSQLGFLAANVILASIYA